MKRFGAKAQLAQFHQLPLALHLPLFSLLVARVLDEICPRIAINHIWTWWCGTVATKEGWGAKQLLWNEANLQLWMVTKLQKGRDIYLPMKDKDVSENWYAPACDYFCMSCVISINTVERENKKLAIPN